MFPRIVPVDHLHNYVLRIGFFDHLFADVDLGDELEGPIFEPLRNIELFRSVRLDEDTHTIVWPNGADFAPEFLRELAMAVASR